MLYHTTKMTVLNEPCFLNITKRTCTNCINGTTYDCAPAFDDGHHGHKFVPPGGFVPERLVGVVKGPKAREEAPP